MLWGVGILLTVYLVLCALMARAYLHPVRDVPRLPRDLAEETPDRVPTWVTSGWREAPVVFICAHGYGGNRATWDPLMGRLAAAGFGAVAPSMPGQDASPVAAVGFGRAEAVQIVQTAAWVRRESRVRPKIVLLGLSLGGAASWMAAEEVRPDAVVTEGAFARFSPVMDRFLGRLVPGGAVALRPMVWMARAMSGVDPASVRPVASAAHWKGPALVIHGTADRLIPMADAEALAEAAGAELWRVEGARHAHCQDVAGPAYAARLATLARSLR